VDWDTEREKVLVEAARLGDRAAFGQLYDHYLPKIYGRVCALVPLTDAEDVTQEVFISVARSIGNFGGRSAFSTWMHSIVKRRVADYYRRIARQTLQVPMDDDCGVSADPPPITIEEELIIKQVLYTLPERQREVILLRLVEGLPFAQVASRLGVKVGAAKVRFYRAIRACRERLAEADVTPTVQRATHEVEKGHG
jgi:RNA polymerase sigma-70 factor (ECF subfamily)